MNIPIIIAISLLMAAYLGLLLGFLIKCSREVAQIKRLLNSSIAQPQDIVQELGVPQPVVYQQPTPTAMPTQNPVVLATDRMAKARAARTWANAKKRQPQQEAATPEPQKEKPLDPRVAAQIGKYQAEIDKLRNLKK